MVYYQFIIQKHFMQGKNRTINTLSSDQYSKQSEEIKCVKALRNKSDDI